MGQNTSRLGLYLPGGGSTGLITPDEPADIDKINDNMTKIDADAGVFFCTSSTRPSTPYGGKIIYETDTKETRVWNSSASRWDPASAQGQRVANAAARDVLFPSPVQGNEVFRIDLGYTETYYALYNSSTNPGGRATAGWYGNQRNIGLVPIVPPTVAVSGGVATANSLGLITFTSVTSISLNGIFSNAYTSYRIVYRAAPSVGTDLDFRMRNAGTDSSASYYTSGWNFTAGSTGSGYSGSNISYAVLGSGTVGWPIMGQADIYNPFLAEATKMTFNSSGHNTAQPCSYFGGVAHNVASSYDSLTIYPHIGGNITGTIQIFGYNS